MKHTLRVLFWIVLLTGCGKSLSPVNYTDGGLNAPAEKGKLYRWSFDDVAVSSLPDKFFSVLGTWQVEADAAAVSATNVLRQSGKFKGDDFPRLIVKDLSFSDFSLRVRCRPESGDTDQACGVLFRAQDSDNYYIARANALEGNINFYRVINGDRQAIKSADGSVAKGTWHTLEINTQGNETRVSWDSKEVLMARDDSFSAGKVGLWTKADSVTAFDDLEVTEH